MTAGPAAREALAGRLRARVGEGRYLEAQAALAEYCGALRTAAEGLPPGDPLLHALEQEWQRLLEETRREVLAGRAHAAARLARLPRLCEPYGGPPPPRPTWQCFA